MIFDASTEMVEAKISLQRQQSIAIVCEKPQSQLFKYLYFSKMSKAAKIHCAQEVLIQLKNDSPLSFCFKMKGMGTLNFYLAPLIEEQ